MEKEEIQLFALSLKNPDEYDKKTQEIEYYYDLHMIAQDIYKTIAEKLGDAEAQEFLTMARIQLLSRGVQDQLDTKKQELSELYGKTEIIKKIETLRLEKDTLEAEIATNHSKEELLQSISELEAKREKLEDDINKLQEVHKDYPIKRLFICNYKPTNQRTSQKYILPFYLDENSISTSEISNKFNYYRLISIDGTREAVISLTKGPKVEESSEEEKQIPYSNCTISTIYSIQEVYNMMGKSGFIPNDAVSQYELEKMCETVAEYEQTLAESRKRKRTL